MSSKRWKAKPRVAARRCVQGLLLTLASAVAASATPPDSIDIRDELLGTSARAVLLLRTAYDNLGVYDAEVRTVTLVAIDRDTLEETAWPVYRVRRQPTADMDSLTGPDQVVIEKLKDAINPFDIMREYHALPITAPQGFYAQEALLAQYSEGQLVVTDRNGQSFSRPINAALAAVSASVELLAKDWQDYDRLAPIETTDLLVGRSFSEKGCNLSEVVAVQDQLGGRPLMLTRLDCVDDDEYQATSAFVPLPVSPK